MNESENIHRPIRLACPLSKEQPEKEKKRKTIVTARKDQTVKHHGIQHQFDTRSSLSNRP
jgi:hypothetical protein